MGWFFLSILITPIYTIFIIFFLGETEEKRKKEFFKKNRKFSIGNYTQINVIMKTKHLLLILLLGVVS